MPKEQTLTRQETTINFKTKLYKIGDWTILRLPEDASAKLPSRGQVMVEGTINGVQLKTPLEPDGKWSHWLKVEKNFQDTIGAKAGDEVTLSIMPTKEWSEPEIPADIMKAVEAIPEVHELWQRITPLARWEWLRWIRSTSRDETRKHRIEVACSKLKSGMRRPCCYNRNACSEPSVSKNGILLELK